MGEANRRKAAESNFGRVPKNKDYRGLIVSCPIKIDGKAVTIIQSALDPQELRFALMFWEKLIWPSSRNIFITSGPNEQYLESAGVLSRPEYTLNGDVGIALAYAQYQAFRDREEQEPGVWAMCQGDNFLSFVDSSSKKDAGALLELHRAIPIPTEDVPLAEILEFRERRRDELWILRAHLETFVADLEATQDRPERLTEQIAEIDRACTDLLKLGTEWKFPVYLADIKAAFNLTASKAGPLFLGGMLSAQGMGLNTTGAFLAGLGGAALSTLEIKADWARAKKPPSTPYRYAFNIHQELR